MAEVETSIEAFTRAMERVFSASTATKYTSAAKMFLRCVKFNGYNDLTKLPRGFLNQYVAMLVDEGYAPSSVQVYFAGVKRYLRWIDDQGVDLPKLNKPDLPRQRHVMRDALAPDVVEQYFDLCEQFLHEPYRSAAMLLPCCGLRASELCELPLAAVRTQSVRLKDGSTHRSVALRVKGKGGKERTVPLTDAGARILVGYLNGYRRERKGPHCFPGKRNKYNKSDTRCISDRTLRTILTKVREPMGLNFTAHTMRRTYLLSLHRQGVDAVTLAKIAGHTSIQTLYKHYLMLDDHDVIAAVAEGEKRNAKR